MQHKFAEHAWKIKGTRRIFTYYAEKTQRTRGKTHKKQNTSMKKTKKTLNLNCPLDNDYKIGVTWAETH